MKVTEGRRCLLVFFLFGGAFVAMWLSGCARIICNHPRPFPMYDLRGERVLAVVRVDANAATEIPPQILPALRQSVTERFSQCAGVELVRLPVKESLPTATKDPEAWAYLGAVAGATVVVVVEPREFLTRSRPSGTTRDGLWTYLYVVDVESRRGHHQGSVFARAPSELSIETGEATFAGLVEETSNGISDRLMSPPDIYR